MVIVIVIVVGTATEAITEVVMVIVTALAVLVAFVAQVQRWREMELAGNEQCIQVLWTICYIIYSNMMQYTIM